MALIIILHGQQGALVFLKYPSQLKQTLPHILQRFEAKLTFFLLFKLVLALSQLLMENGLLVFSVYEVEKKHMHVCGLFGLN